MARTRGTSMHSPPQTNVDAEPALPAKVKFLQQPRSYPDPTTVVTTVETHRSWVFLTDRYAYKLKKPGYYGFLDARTVSARKYYCEEELRLNARFAGDVYLATLPLTVDRGGCMVLGGTGSIADWLIKMRRLPAARMLDTAIERNTLSPDQIRAVARKLAHLYSAATPVKFALGEYQVGFLRDVRANLDELGRPLFGLREDLIRAPCDAQIRFLNRNPESFEQRAREGRIIEAHDDLRPEHVCLLEPEPVIIDCLEFDRALRTLDAAAELAFLAQECERLGAPQVGQVVFAIYGEITHDRPPAKLLSFYKSYWACLRAKLCVWHLADPLCRDPDKWSRLATDYLIRARRYADNLG